MTKDIFLASCVCASLASGKSQDKIFLYRGNLTAYHLEYSGTKECISSSLKIYDANYIYW